jgi:tRNA (Thr-GGU) A37 N-methylase
VVVGLFFWTGEEGRRRTIAFAGNGPLTGVFRTRSPDRPNPLGVHRVTVTALESPDTLRVAALEAIDGTPIIDLKIAMREAPEA